MAANQDRGSERRGGFSLSRRVQLVPAVVIAATMLVGSGYVAPGQVGGGPVAAREQLYCPTSYQYDELNYDPFYGYSCPDGSPVIVVPWGMPDFDVEIGEIKVTQTSPNDSFYEDKGDQPTKYGGTGGQPTKGDYLGERGGVRSSPPPGEEKGGSAGQDDVEVEIGKIKVTPQPSPAECLRKGKDTALACVDLSPATCAVGILETLHCFEPDSITFPQSCHESYEATVRCLMNDRSLRSVSGEESAATADQATQSNGTSVSTPPTSTDRKAGSAKNGKGGKKSKSAKGSKGKNRSLAQVRVSTQDDAANRDRARANGHDRRGKGHQARGNSQDARGKGHNRGGNANTGHGKGKGAKDRGRGEHGRGHENNGHNGKGGKRR
jgi:hypothetical protein